MALLYHLSLHVMAQQVEPDFIDPDGFRVHVLIIAQTMKKSRHKGFYHKATIVGEMVSDILKAADLLVLGQQVEQRVEN